MGEEIKELKRVVLEVFGGCNYTCQMCPQSNPGRGSSFTRKMPLKDFKKILDELVPKYGRPQINLEGSGEPTIRLVTHLDVDAIAVDQLAIEINNFFG